MKDLHIIDRNDLSTFKPALMFGGIKPCALVRIGNSRFPSSISFPELPFAHEYTAILSVVFDNVTPQEVFNAENTRLANMRPLNGDKAADIVAFVTSNIKEDTTVVLSEHFGRTKTGTLAISLFEFYGKENRLREAVLSPDFFVNGHVLKLMRQALGTSKEQLDKLYYEVFGTRLNSTLNGIVS